MAASVSPIPLRFLDRPPANADVIGNRAVWHCACAAFDDLRAESGETDGPTPESIVTCPACGRAFWVIPWDQPRSRPVEVIELSRFRW